MKEDAIAKALTHVIPFEEVNTLGGDAFISIDDEEDGEATLTTAVTAPVNAPQVLDASGQPTKPQTPPQQTK